MLSKRVVLICCILLPQCLPSRRLARLDLNSLEPDHVPSSELKVEAAAEATASAEAKAAAEGKIAEATGISGPDAQRPGETQFKWAMRLREQEAAEAAAGMPAFRGRADELAAMTPSVAKARQQAKRNAEDAEEERLAKLRERQEDLQKNGIKRDGQAGRVAAEAQREVSLKKQGADQGKADELAAMTPAVAIAREKSKSLFEDVEEQRLAKLRERQEWSPGAARREAKAAKAKAEKEANEEAKMIQK